ncbi:hypothetical protein AMECASPLE_000522 [Ameca splendens]|uniref:Uncharacterized protein n=1 Tax=Ameca splendens TaxID=208324 RepID=A0ABV0YWH9_9TELE
MNGCLLTCSKTIWSCQGSGGQSSEKVQFVDDFSKKQEKFCGQNIAGTLWEEPLCHTHSHADSVTHTRWGKGERRVCGDATWCLFLSREKLLRKPPGNFFHSSPSLSSSGWWSLSLFSSARKLQLKAVPHV